MIGEDSDKRPFENEWVFRGKLVASSGREYPVQRAAVRANRVLGGPIRVHLLLEKFDAEDLMFGTVRLSNEEETRISPDLEITHLGMSGDRPAEAHGQAGTFDERREQDPPTQGHIRVHASCSYGAWQFAAGPELPMRDVRLALRPPLELALCDGKARLSSNVEREGLSIGVRFLRTVHLADEAVLDVAESQSFGQNVWDRGESLLFPLMLAAREAAAVTCHELFEDGTAPGTGVRVRRLVRYRSTLSWDRPRTASPLIHYGHLPDYLVVAHDARSRLADPSGLDRSIALLARYHEEVDFMAGLSLLCIALESAVTALAGERKLDKVRWDATARCALDQFLSFLDNADRAHIADIVRQKRGEFRRPTFATLLSALAHSYEVRLDDIGCAAFAFAKLIRNKLFHGRAVEPTQELLLERDRLVCFLERLLLRALDWTEKRGSTVDADGQAPHYLNARLSTARK